MKELDHHHNCIKVANLYNNLIKIKQVKMIRIFLSLLSIYIYKINKFHYQVIVTMNNYKEKAFLWLRVISIN
jgi:hypothetical protein